MRAPFDPNNTSGPASHVDVNADTDRDGRGLDRRSFLRAGLLLAGGGVAGARVPAALAASRTRIHAAPATSTPPPNILVILVDQMRAPCWFGAGVSADGLPPSLARLRNGGVTFARHYTASNDCTPARAALLTGLHTHQTGCMITGESTLDPRFPTWGNMLSAHGYSSYWYGKWHLTHGDSAWTSSSGPRGLGRYGFGGGTFPSPNGAPGQGSQADPTITAQFAQWYEDAGGAGPWCTTVSFVNPHDIAWWYRYSGADAIDTSYFGAPSRLPGNFETPAQLVARGKPLLQQSLQETAAQSFGTVPFSGPNVQASWAPFIDLYASLQRAVDVQIGAVLDTLASRPQVAANTVVLFTSDHGEYGGSHGLRGKGAGVYEEAIRVPLIVSDPRHRLTSAPAQPRAQLTSSVDIAPLLLTIACGSGEWRTDRRYRDLAARPDLAAILADATASGRSYALHATDEVVTEFALAPYVASAPLHITAVITPTAKFATYSNWRPGTVQPLERGAQTELYDYSTRGGRLEIENVAGRGQPLERQLRRTLAQATQHELHAPLAQRLHGAQQQAVAGYLRISASEAHASRSSRQHRLKPTVPGATTTTT
jgi:arylsulfatase A-like enzyme